MADNTQEIQLAEVKYLPWPTNPQLCAVLVLRASRYLEDVSIYRESAVWDERTFDMFSYHLEALFSHINNTNGEEHGKPPYDGIGRLTGS